VVPARARARGKPLCRPRPAKPTDCPAGIAEHAEPLGEEDPWQDLSSIARYDRVLSVEGSTIGGRLCAGERDSKDPLVSPLYADLKGLAPWRS
jgi:hypothetical protein